MEAKQVRDLMEAYASVYQEKEEVSEDLQKTVGQALDAAAKNPVIKAIGKVIAPVGSGRGTVTKAEQEKTIEKNVAKEEVEVIEEKKRIAHGSGKKAMPSKKERSALAKRARAGEDIGKPGKGFKKVAEKAAKQYGSKEAGERVAAAAMFRNEEVETDLFDYLLEYLVAEGYADTNKAALAIMANMSEEWKQSIVEADSVAAMRERAAKRRKQRYGDEKFGRDDFRPYTEDDYKKPGSGASGQVKDA